MRTFIAEHAKEHRSLRLRIDGHASIAFAVGRLLDVKSGIATEIEQRTSGAGLQYWRAESTSNSPALEVTSKGIANRDVVVALSITHNVLDNVESYCQTAFAAGYQLYDARLSGADTRIFSKQYSPSRIIQRNPRLRLAVDS